MADDKSLSLRLRKGIRDVYDSPESGIAASVKKAGSILGQQVVIDPHWAVLAKKLEPAYQDARDIAPAITNTVQIFLEVFNESLSGSNGQQLISFIAGKTAGQELTIALDVSADQHERFTHASWQDNRLVLLLAPTSERVDKSRIVRLLQMDLQRLPAAPATSAAPPTTAPQVSAPAVTQSALPVTSSGSSTAPAPVAAPSYVPRYGTPSQVPRSDDIEDPDVLLSRPPYNVILEQTPTSWLITADHEDTLLAIEGYLKRYARKNDQFGPGHNDRSRMQLHERAFGKSAAYDTLEIHFMSVRGSPTIVLSLLHKVLGYTLLTQLSDAKHYHYVRNEAFA